MGTNKSNYNNFLNKVVEIREQRKKLYGNSWMKNEDWELLAMLKHKIGRLQELVFNEKKNAYETKIDTIVDLINYAIFMGVNEERKNEK